LTRLKRRLPAAWQSGIWAPQEPIALTGDPDAHLWVSRIDPGPVHHRPAGGAVKPRPAGVRVRGTFCLLPFGGVSILRGA
jgi:hypothetical protein